MPQQLAACKAEVLLAMQSVISYMPHDSMNDFAELFKMMFRDSNVASKMEIWKQVGQNVDKK